MANEPRAWQRTTKSGKTVAYARVGDNAIRVSGEAEIVRRVMSIFADQLGADLSLEPAAVIEGQTDIYEQLGQQP